MDDLYHFMGPAAIKTTPDAPATMTVPDTSKTATDGDIPSTVASSSSPSTNSPAAMSSNLLGSWAPSTSGWGSSFNKLLERGKKDMNEFVDVTRKDFSELVSTVQSESSTTLESLKGRVEVLKTSLPPSVTSVVDGIAEVATGKSPQSQAATDATTTTTTASAGEVSPVSTASVEGAVLAKDGAAKELSVEEQASSSTSTPTITSNSAAAQTASSGSKKLGLTFASTASLLTSRANALSQSLSMSTKDLGTSANTLFKKTLPAVAEKHMGEADSFLKNTTETLKTNGLLAEQYVNHLGAGVANFINSAVVVSAPSASETSGKSKSKKLVFDRKEARLEKLRLDPQTYTVDPMTTLADNDVVGLERYKFFLQTFNMAEYSQRISRLLNEYPEIRTLMTKLVPSEVEDEELFWLRYHFRLFEIEEEEKRRLKLVQEAGKDDDDEFTWDNNDDSDSETEKTSAKENQATPKAKVVKKPEEDLSEVTPTSSQILSKSDELAALTSSGVASAPKSTTTTATSNKSQSDDDDEWGAESVQSPTTDSSKKSPTSLMSSTRTSEDAYEVLDGVRTPIRVPLANVLATTSGATSPQPKQPSTLSSPPTTSTAASGASRTKANKEDEEGEEWSDWE